MSNSNMTPHRIVFFGASGAVGGEAVKHLISRADAALLTLLNRRPIDLPASPRVQQHIVDITSPSTYAPFLPGHDAAICTLGVGQPSKVSKEEFTRIDKQAVLDFATACKRADVKQFTLLGSVGADPASRSFYLRSKGELRDAIAALGFERFTVFQPSMILTPVNRYGLSQAVLLKLWPIVSALLAGPLARYKGIRVETLGKAIARTVFTPGQGVEVLHWPDIRRLADAA